MDIPGDGQLKTYDEALKALSCHLSLEIECLEEMLDLLETESDALRRISLGDLDKIAPQKEKAVNRHAQLAHHRAQLLAACTAGQEKPTFGQLIDECGLEADDPFVQRVTKTRSLAIAIADQNNRNRTFAQSGHGLVSGLVRLVDAWRSPQAKTYASNGHIRSSLLDAVPRGSHVCSA